MDEIGRALLWYGVKGREEKGARLTEYAREVGDRRAWGGLTSRRAARELEPGIVDSLCMLSALDCREPLKVVDVGSGGGLLGLTLAIACESWEVTLVESSTRKSTFLAEVTGKLEIGNARVINTRAQDLPGDGEYDAAVSRAAGSVSEILPLVVRLLKPGGRYVALKGSDPGLELEDIRGVAEASGAKVSGIVKPGFYAETGATARASLIILEKL